MNQIKTFQNSEFGTIRIVEMNGQPHFVGKDVAAVLGYNNPRDALAKHVDIEDRGVAKCDTLGGVQNLTVINESGLYSLILSSKLPNTRKFKHWVTNEVLPSIRKYGMYAVDEILSNPDMLIATLQALKEERTKRQTLELETAVQKQQIAELRPKASYYDLILQNKSTVPITQIAKDYGMSGRKFNQLLRDMSVQYRMGSTWILYQEYAQYGYTQSRTYAVDADKSVMHTYWTQKGRLFLYGLLKQHGILPVMEKETSD